MYRDAEEFAEYQPTLGINEVTRILTDHGLVDSAMNWVDDEHEQDSVWQIAYKVDSDREFFGYDWQWNTDEFMGWLGY